MIGELEKADVYVITVPYIYETIDKLLQGKLGEDIKTVGIDEIVFEL